MADDKKKAPPGPDAANGTGDGAGAGATEPGDASTANPATANPATDAVQAPPTIEKNGKPTIEKNGKLYHRTTVGLPNTCSGSGADPGPFWYAEHDDAARAGIGFSRQYLEGLS